MPTRHDRLPSIRNRLIILVLGLFITIWGVMMAAAYITTRHEIEEVEDAQLGQAMHVLHDLVAHEVSEQELNNIELDIPDNFQFHPYEKKLAFQVWDHENLVLRSGSAPANPMTNIEGFSDNIIDGQKWRLLMNRDKDQSIRFIIGERYEIRNELISTILLHVSWPMLIALPFLAFLITVGISRGLAPLRRVADDVSRRSPQQLNPIAIDEVPMEVEPLVTSLNELLARLDKAFESERRFTANAAHELRTPLAALKAQAQVAMKADHKEQRMWAMEQIIRGVDRSTHLVEQLLTLARLDPESAASSHEPVNMSAIVERTCSELAPSAVRKHIDLEYIANNSETVKGMPTAISILARNLIDNAIRYTQEDGKISVSVYKDNNSVVLSVTDNGPGIPEQERPRVLDRFYRIVGNKETGSGLGLSIVKRIAELHNATMDISQPKSKTGTRITVSFPT
jgi:two-component system sensor histidine kinase QseC